MKHRDPFVAYPSVATSNEVVVNKKQHNVILNSCSEIQAEGLYDPLQDSFGRYV